MTEDHIHHEPQPDREKQKRLIREKYFRQIVAVGKLFAEMYGNEPGAVDHESKKILFAENKTPDQDLEEVYADQVENKYWVKILDNGDVEFTLESTSYDRKSETDNSLANQDFDIGGENPFSRMSSRAQEDKKQRDEDPIGFEVEQASSKILVRESRTILIFSPKNQTLEKRYWQRQWLNGSLISGPKPGKENPDVESVSLENPSIREMLDNLHLALTSQLANALYEADLGFERFTRLFPSHIKKEILSLALQEIRTAAETKLLPPEENRVYLDGIIAPLPDDYYHPQAQFKLRSTATNQHGQIKIENTELRQVLTESRLVEVIPVPPPTHKNAGFAELSMAQDRAMEILENWKQQVEKDIGLEELDQWLAQEIDRLTVLLAENNETVTGSMRTISIDPQSSNYRYKRMIRSYSTAPHTPAKDEIFDIQTGNPENPSYDELLMLWSIARSVPAPPL